MLQFLISLYSELAASLQGIASAATVNLVHQNIDEVQRGKSPDKKMLRIMQFQYGIFSFIALQVLNLLKWARVTQYLAVGLTFGLPTLITFWPKNPDYNHFQNKCQELAKKMKQSKKWLPIRPFFAIFNLLVQKTPFIKPFYKPSVKLVQYLDANLNHIYLGLNFFSQIVLFSLGYQTLACSAVFIFTVGILERKNLLSLKTRELLHKYLIPICLFGGIVYGEMAEKILTLTVVCMSYGQYFQSFIISLFSALGVKREFTEVLKEQKRKMNGFDFECNAENFFESIEALSKAPCEINKRHVLNNAILMPPNHPNEDPHHLLVLFNRIENWEEHITVIKDYLKNDWRVKEENIIKGNTIFPPHLTDAELKDEAVKYMRTNIETFLELLRSGGFQGLKMGAVHTILRYTRAIVYNLKKCEPNSKEFVNAIIRLGFETGEYCSKEVLEVLEKVYRNQMHLDDKPSLEKNARLLLQSHRELYFQSKYLKEKLHDLYLEQIIIWSKFIKKRVKISTNHPNDIHAYEQAIAYFAPRLGLSAIHFECSSEQDNPMAELWFNILSASSDIEYDFWKTTSIATLKKQIVDAFASPAIPLNNFHSWYEEFIDKHVIGTQEQKDALKATLPYESATFENITFYRLKEEFVHLMMLDFGVIYLKGNNKKEENYFRYQPVPKAPVLEKQKTLQFSNQDLSALPQPSVVVPVPPPANPKLSA